MAVRQGKGERKNQKSPEGIQIGQIPVIFFAYEGAFTPYAPPVDCGGFRPVSFW